MPHAPPEMLLPTTLAFTGFGPAMKIPTILERLISLERILVPVVSSSTNTPSQLPMRSFPATVVSMLFSSTSIALWPKGMLLTTFFTTVVLRARLPTMMPSLSVLGLPITWFFATVVLTLLPATIPPATFPMARFPTTVALRAPKTSIPYALLPPFPLILKPRIVNPETLTSLTRGPPCGDDVQRSPTPIGQGRRRGSALPLGIMHQNGG